MPEFERPPQSPSMGVPKPRHEYKPAYTPPIQKQESPEVFKEESALTRIVSSATTFFEDVGNANKAAQKSLHETAMSRVGKGLAVTAVGGALEFLAEEIFGQAVAKLNSTKIDKNRALGLINRPIVREALEDIGIFVAYNAGNKLMENALPKLPASSLVAAWGVDAGEGAWRKVTHNTKAVSQVEIDKGKLNFTVNPDRVSPEKSRLMRVVNFSNPVTLFGIAQIYQGVGEYARAFREIRRTRKQEGEKGVEQLLIGVGKAETADKRKKQVDRILKSLESENGNHAKHT